MLFITWALVQGFPWFVFVHIAWGPFLAIHYYRTRNAENTLPTTATVNLSVNDQPVFVPQPMPPQFFATPTTTATTTTTNAPVYFMPVYQTQQGFYQTAQPAYNPQVPPTLYPVISQQQPVPQEQPKYDEETKS